MTIVIDASAAVEMALRGPLADLFSKTVSDADIVIAPDTFVSEVTNAFWKYRKFSDFSDEKCVEGIAYCVSIIDIFAETKELWREAYFEGIRNQHSTYDMFYFVCARRNGAALLSKDKVLREIAVREGLQVI